MAVYARGSANRQQIDRAHNAAQGSATKSSSGTKFAFPDLSRKAAEDLGSIYSNLAGNFSQPDGAFGSGGTSGGGAGFGDYSTNVGGPRTQFSPINTSGVYTPDLMNREINSIWGNQDARMANNQLQARQQVPFGQSGNSPSQLQRQDDIQRASGAIGGGLEQGFRMDAAKANRDMQLASEIARANVEGNISQDDVNRRQLGLSARGQDINKEVSFFQTLMGLLGGLGGAGAGGLLGAQPFSQSVATTGPVATLNRSRELIQG